MQAAGGAGLLDVLVAGYGVDNRVAARLKQETGGSDFVFTTGGAGNRVDSAGRGSLREFAHIGHRY